MPRKEQSCKTLSLTREKASFHDGRPPSEGKRGRNAWGSRNGRVKKKVRRFSATEGRTSLSTIWGLKSQKKGKGGVAAPDRRKRKGVLIAFAGLSYVIETEGPGEKEETDAARRSGGGRSAAVKDKV